MDLLQIITLALVQGFTEFLPVSSSAHLILVPILVGWKDQGLAFDVAVHLGTLTAVLYYFRRELGPMIRDWLTSIRTHQQTPNSKLAWGIILGTIPVGVVGLLAKDFIEGNLRTPLIIAVATIVFGLLLWWADARGKHQRSEYQINLRDILLIGCAQALALIPGTSRSGITITAGLMLGLSRTGAARFSFLLSIPAILLPGALKTLDLIKDDMPVDWHALYMGAFVSGIFAYFTIKLFIQLLDKLGMLPFVIYRLVLGGILLLMFM